MKPATMRASEAWLDEARRHHQAGALPQAEALYRQILARDPNEAAALGLLGRLGLQTGHPAAGLGLVEQALVLRPGDPELLGHQAACLKALGRLPEAVAALRQAVRARPGDFALLYNLGNAERESGELAAAAATLRRAIRRDPANVDALNNLGTVLRQQGRYHEAVACFARAVSRRPEAAPLHFNLAAALDLAGDADGAVQSLHAALARAPSAEAWHLLGTILVRLRRLDEAGAALNAALALADSPALRTAIAAVMAAQGAREAAVPHLRAAAAQAPDDAGVLTDLGTLLRDTNDDAGAVAALSQALRLDPDHARAKYHLGLTHLLAGRLREGWPLYEFRLPAMTGAVTRFAAPIWRGESMAGQTLLLHAEQGLGDTLEFCRFVPLAAAASRARIVLEVQPPLLRLLRGVAGVDLILPTGAPLPAFDRHCPLPSLPIALDITLDDLPGAIPYLTADRIEVAQWQRRLAPVPGRRIGLVWAGNPEYEHDDLRSLPPHQLAPLAGAPGVSFVSLQKDHPAPPLIAADWTAALTDVADTAALMGALDLVISADTAMVHLAGALGRPAWLLNRYDTDWRWLRDRPLDSPWYPTLRQFRQPRRGDWPAVIGAVAAALGQEWQPRADAGS